MRGGLESIKMDKLFCMMTEVKSTSQSLQTASLNQITKWLRKTVRFYLKTLKGEVKLPCKNSMLDDLKEEICHKQETGVPVRKYHNMEGKMKSYLNDLADTAQLEHLPPVVHKIYEETQHLRETNLAGYRNVLFHRLDDNNYKTTVSESND